MADIIRDTALGVTIRFLTKNRWLPYPEEKPGFRLPDTWLQQLDNDDDPEGSDLAGDDEGRQTDEEKKRDTDGDTDTNADNNPYASPSTTHVGQALHHTRSREETLPYTEARRSVDELHAVERTRSVPVVPRRVRTGEDGPTTIVVDWYASDDQANPQNWSVRRRVATAGIICLYTFVVYTSSAIYTPSETGVMASFGVDNTQAALGLALFVLGYGMGPLLFSPLSEIAAIGRNPVYAVTMVLYVAVSLPTALAYGNHHHHDAAGNDVYSSSGKFAGLMVLRFLQGVFGSPCLAAGAASLGDLFSQMALPFALVAWVGAAYCGPSLGPLLSGFSVAAKGWRWSLLEILWAAAPCCLVMLTLLPETSAEAILLRRAQRLRRLLGSDRFQAPSEVRDAEAVAAGRPHGATAVVVDALIKPVEITVKDPAVLFVLIYTGIIYGIYYSFFEVFPLVFLDRYHMNAGQTGLVFLCILVSCLLGSACYCGFLLLYLYPRIMRGGPAADFAMRHESRLIPALYASFGPVVGLFLFAWTAEHAPRVPWIAPVIGVTIYGASAFVIMQCLFVYIPMSYPRYAASLFAGNDFSRSAFAFASVLYGRPLFVNLGIGRGVSVLGGLSFMGIIGVWLLYYYGARLRAMSKFTQK